MNFPRRIILAVTVFGLAAAASAADQSLSSSIKKIFTTPTPTPAHKHHSATKKSSPTPTASPKPKPSASPSPSESPKSKRKHKGTATPSATPSTTPSATPSPIATPSPTEKPSDSPPTTPARSPEGGKQHAPNASLRPEEVTGFESYRPEVQKLLSSALDLTTRNLDYKYGSADPAGGGMDCSGFIYYVLKQNGVADPPRDSAGQYTWLRKANRFAAVVSRTDDAFELNDLKPGDLLFWTGTYKIDRDPPITHVMIYLGREKATNQRVMVGSSDGRSFKGQQRWGVSVFDFKVSRRESANGALTPVFVGYGRLPGLD